MTMNGTTSSHEHTVFKSTYLVHRLNNYGHSAITVGMQTPISVSAVVDLGTNDT